MSESSPEVNVDADQVVVNNAPDGGGIDNDAAEPVEEPETDQGDSDK